jgi:PAS domain S-box-containing protein
MYLLKDDLKVKTEPFMKTYGYQLLGPFLALLTCASLQFLAAKQMGIPNPPAILLLVIVYASFVGGLLSGSISAVIGWLYIAYFFSLPGARFQYTEENLHRVVIWAITISLIVVMVGVLKKRSIDAIYQKLKEKSHNEKIQNIQLSVNRTLVESLSIPAAAEKVLKTIAESFDYDFGGFWELNPEQTSLSLSAVWCREKPALKEFERVNRSVHLEKNLELPGQVAASANQIWIQDVTQDKVNSALRKKQILQCGFRTGFAFPIMGDSAVIGVMEFFSESPRSPEAGQSEMLVDIGHRFGLYLKRYSAEQELRKLYQELEARIKERTEALLRSEVELRLITNALPVGIAYIDRNQRYKFCNDTHCRWHQRPREQLIGKTICDVLGPTEHKRMLPYINQALKGQMISEEVVVNYAAGTKMIDLSCIPDCDETGFVRGFVLLVNDISAHKEVEFQLKQAKEAAEAASEAKSSFLANMSHEIRTPLGVILGFSEILASENLKPSDKASYVEIIQRNGTLLSGIINDILDLSKVESDKLEIEKQETSVSEVLSDVIATLSPQAQKKKLKLITKTAGLSPSTIQTDPIRLRQILINIIGNAIKFTPQGSVEITTELQKKETGEGPLLAFVVKDSGIGIALDQAMKLFRPFTQADPSMRRRFGGTGLGLAFSRRLAQLLGGDVKLSESERDKGSTFTVTIDPGPVSYDSSALNAPAKSEASQRSRELIKA